MKSRMTAALLALFLGGLGVHKFYLGRGLQGVLYFLFSWTFVPAFIGFIEGIGLLLSSDQAFNLKYNGTAAMGIMPQIVVNNNATATNTNIETDISLQLEKLHKLKESGAISDEEYQKQKEKVLS